MFLYFSIGWSFFSNVTSHIKGLSAKRGKFGITSKLTVAVYSFFSITARVLAIIAFFTPSLGLFNSLRHWQGEMFRWHPALIEKFVDNKTICQAGQSLMPMKSIFKLENMWGGFADQFQENITSLPSPTWFYANLGKGFFCPPSFH